MEVNIFKNENEKIAEVVSGSVIIRSTQDALDLMVSPKIGGARKIIIYKENFAPDFFDLKTGLAGEILQKFVNYQIKLAIVGDFKNIASESLKAFIAESNKGNHIYFLEDADTAKEFLGKASQ
jgi:hypothetical protein